MNEPLRLGNLLGHNPLFTFQDGRLPGTGAVGLEQFLGAPLNAPMHASTVGGAFETAAVGFRALVPRPGLVEQPVQAIPGPPTWNPTPRSWPRGQTFPDIMVALQCGSELGAAVLGGADGAAHLDVFPTEQFLSSCGERAGVEQFRLAGRIDGLARRLLALPFRAEALSLGEQIGQEACLEFLEPLFRQSRSLGAVLTGHQLGTEARLAHVHLPSGGILFHQDHGAQFHLVGGLKANTRIDGVGPAPFVMG